MAWALHAAYAHVIQVVIMVQKHIHGPKGDYSDTTVVIPVKDEPAVWKVANGVLKALAGCKVLIIYKNGDGKPGLQAGKGKEVLHVGVKVIRQTDSGKGMACIHAAKHVSTPIICFIDGDATYDARDLKRMISLVRGGADMVLGDRLSNVSLKAMPRFIQMGNWVLTATANLLYGMHIRDSQTGIRAIRKPSWDRMGLAEKNFGIETEMNIKARKNGMTIVEIPVKYYLRIGTTKQRKVVDGLKLFLTNFKFLFS